MFWDSFLVSVPCGQMPYRRFEVAAQPFRLGLHLHLLGLLGGVGVG